LGRRGDEVRDMVMVLALVSVGDGEDSVEGILMGIHHIETDGVGEGVGSSDDVSCVSDLLCNHRMPASPMYTSYSFKISTSIFGSFRTPPMQM
jgi:hypothetical protein